MDFGIAGKWALVCGASKGLGYGCAQALVREGVNVVIVARTPEPLEQAAARLKNEAQRSGQDVSVLPVAADITSAAGREAVFAVSGGPGKDFDIVVTNAGGPPPGNFRDWDVAIWQSALNANMLTPLELIRAVIDGMVARKFGRISNITSVSVKAPIDLLGLSTGARAGLTGAVAGIARSEIAAANVTINNLLPGAFDTDRLRSTIEADADKRGAPLDATIEARLATIPARRFGTPEEFGATCAFLCSQHASYITGQNILLDGGAYPGTF